jgi:hypothetical protein
MLNGRNPLPSIRSPRERVTGRCRSSRRILTKGSDSQVSAGRSERVRTTASDRQAISRMIGHSEPGGGSLVAQGVTPGNETVHLFMGALPRARDSRP